MAITKAWAEQEKKLLKSPQDGLGTNFCTHACVKYFKKITNNSSQYGFCGDACSLLWLGHRNSYALKTHTDPCRAERNGAHCTQRSRVRLFHTSFPSFTNNIHSIHHMPGWWHPREREAAKHACTIQRNTRKCMDHAHHFQSIPPLLSMIHHIFMI